jgi:hypothetical protein
VSALYQEGSIPLNQPEKSQYKTTYFEPKPKIKGYVQAFLPSSPLCFQLFPTYYILTNFISLQSLLHFLPQEYNLIIYETTQYLTCRISVKPHYIVMRFDLTWSL